MTKEPKINYRIVTEGGNPRPIPPGTYDVTMHAVNKVGKRTMEMDLAVLKTLQTPEQIAAERDMLVAFIDVMSEKTKEIQALADYRLLKLKRANRRVKEMRELLASLYGDQQTS